MFAAAGVGAYEAAMFHLFTHAFFKALLFLGAGSVIHAMHHEQDMRKMGGLRHKIPLTYWMMVIGTLAITGVGIPLTGIGFAGFLSKDIIIETTFARESQAGYYAFALLVTSALFTSFYSWRLIFMTFHGPARGDHHTMKHIHESPPSMTVPLALLAVGALVLGFVFKGTFVTVEGVTAFFRESLFSASGHKIVEELHHIPFWVVLSPMVMMVGGFLLAYRFYIHDPEAPRRLARRHVTLYQFLLNKWYFDEIYDFLFVRPAMRAGHFLWKRGDGWTIDGFGPDGISARVIDVTRGVMRLQTGYLYHYAFVMLIGVAALITWFMVRGGGV
jgi:NADH-quinone oxidoreductase subunit L